MKNLVDMILERKQSKFTHINIHFKNASAAFLYKFELEGQISDGKYEDARPFNHWEWVNDVMCIVDGKEGYEGERGKKKYNLDEWVDYVKDAENNPDSKYAWALRVLDFGRLGLVLDASKVESILGDSQAADGAEQVAQLWGKTLRSNPDAEFADIQVEDWRKPYVSASKIWNKSTFNKFKATEYDIYALIKDLNHMTISVNTCLSPEMHVYYDASLEK